MGKNRILIVEDEWTIAEYLKTCLEELGYSVCSMAVSGEDAIKESEEKHPDLILMDIVLQGKMSGIEAAMAIMEAQDIPVIYLTAYADEDMVTKARESGAYGYLVKPFRENELKASIELALYKHGMERKLKENENRLYATLRSINDAVISTDENGVITFINPLALTLTGWSADNGTGKKLQDIFDLRYCDEAPIHESGNLTEQLVSGHIVTSQMKYMLKTGGMDMYIELSSAPISDDKGSISGAVIAFRDITKRIHIEEELDKYRTHLEDIVKERTLQLTKTNEQLLGEIAERKLIEERIKESLKEKEVLLTEINHRVGNNLQVIYGMLNMQAETTTDKSCINIFRGCQNRIMSMALVHDILYKSRDMAHIDFREYISTLVRRLYRSYGVRQDRVPLKIDIVNASVSMDTAITGGLIINELVSNSLLHAFPDGRKGEIVIELRSWGDHDYELTIGDNGVGLPEGMDVRNTATFGLKTVLSYENRKSWGVFELDRKNGTRFRVRFNDAITEGPADGI